MQVIKAIFDFWGLACQYPVCDRKKIDINVCYSGGCTMAKIIEGKYSKVR